MAKYFVRFQETTQRLESMPMLLEDAERYQPLFPSVQEDADRVLIADLSKEEAEAARVSGAKLYEDFQFFPMANPLQAIPSGMEYWLRGNDAQPTTAPWHTLNLNDVVRHNRAAECWADATGAGVTIGIVDTGVAGAMPEFPTGRHSNLSKTYSYASPWSDPKGHGSMCAAAAAASQDWGGRYNGVAPGANIMSLRTTFGAADIYMLYDWVISQKRLGAFPGPVVLSNSYGVYTCTAPVDLPADHPYLEIVQLAVNEGISVFFAAGNNHVSVCHGDPSQCSPSTIWGVNSVDEVISVGTVNWDERMDVGEHANSSRGPGQWASNFPKPDCVAPTYGETVWGAGYQTMEWWGTSGACPQAAGLAALLLEVDPTLSPFEVYDLVRRSSRDLGLGQQCQGHGIIDCRSALDML